MKNSIKKGFGFGLTTGIITTLGLIIGLAFSTGDKTIVLAGILTIAIADSLSDALGIHISEEATNQKSNKAIWTATISTLATKFIFALTFIIPILLFTLTTAVIISIVWALVAISLFSFYIAKTNKKKAINVVAEHLFIAVFVIVVSYFVGTLLKM
ncbi:hypothetical protein HN643_04510 [Candidatus Falkowbacteria bacterium]|jgi:vacuolar iron transporter family protein|nr:hypothetical protein [Candidatus Falkowbacteria bacterium]MBT5503297.1 hypothetical protein [Candidatus Falkowbacteria bacterium]MBT6574494.1 hypothetical protein [Candidatus Falkowbacteria bacterium]MBT7500902.1 hypothetical protein [Candidatus Falkowbacteria bacterium]